MVTIDQIFIQIFLHSNIHSNIPQIFLIQIFLHFYILISGAARISVRGGTS